MSDNESSIQLNNTDNKEGEKPYYESNSSQVTQNTNSEAFYNSNQQNNNQNNQNPQNPQYNYPNNNSYAPPYNPNAPPQYNPNAPPQYNPNAPPQYNPNAPPQYNTNAPPQYNPNVPPPYNPNASPQYNPNVPPQYNPNVPPPYNPNAPPPYNTNVPPPYNPNVQPLNVVQPVVNSTSASSGVIKRQFCFAWTLLVVVIIDIILEIVLGYVNPFSMGDNAAIIALVIIFLVHSFKMQSVMKIWIGALTVFIWFVGFGCRGFSMTYAIGSGKGESFNPAVPMLNFLILAVRTGLLFFCIPLTCQTQNRRGRY